jgi:uroporphyrinogen-III synthase
MKDDGLTRISTETPLKVRAKSGSGLNDKRVVVTRSADQVDELATLLRYYDAIPVFYPCIAIVPPQDTSALDRALLKASANEFEWLVFTSAHAIEAVVARLDPLNITLGHLKIAVIGPKTARSARELLDTEVDFIASKYVAETLASELNVTKGQRVLLPQSEIARPVLVERLTERGAIVTPVLAYRTVMGQGGDDVPSMLALGQIEAITFTSASTVHHFLARLLNEGGSRSDLEDICLAAIGPVTASALQDASLQATVIPSDYTVEAMVDALEVYFLRNSNRGSNP